MLLRQLLLSGIVLLACACTDGIHAPAATGSTVKPADTTASARPAAATTARQPADSIRGDFNGDGRSELAWLLPPLYNSDSMECADGACEAFIRFSDPALPPISVKQCIGGRPDNLGNLYGDGRDVLGLNPDWFTSCWHGYYTWTYRNGGWKPALDTFSTHCIQWEENEAPPVRAMAGKPGWARIRYSESTDDSIEVRNETVRLRQY